MTANYSILVTTSKCTKCNHILFIADHERQQATRFCNHLQIHQIQAISYLYHITSVRKSQYSGNRLRMHKIQIIFYLYQPANTPMHQIQVISDLYQITSDRKPQYSTYKYTTFMKYQTCTTSRGTANHSILVTTRKYKKNNEIPVISYLY